MTMQAHLFGEEKLLNKHIQGQNQWHNDIYCSACGWWYLLFLFVTNPPLHKRCGKIR